MNQTVRVRAAVFSHIRPQNSILQPSVADRQVGVIQTGRSSKLVVKALALFFQVPAQGNFLGLPEYLITVFSPSLRYRLQVLGFVLFGYQWQQLLHRTEIGRLPVRIWDNNPHDTQSHCCFHFVSVVYATLFIGPKADVSHIVDIARRCKAHPYCDLCLSLFILPVACYTFRFLRIRVNKVRIPGLREHFGSGS